MNETTKINFNNPDGSFNRDKWLDFMNNKIDNIDETLPTQTLDDSLAYKNNISHNTYIFDNGWIPRVSLDSVKYIENPKVLIKFEPKKIFKEDVANLLIILELNNKNLYLKN